MIIFEEIVDLFPKKELLLTVANELHIIDEGTE